jgi:hypothetical protein
VTEHRLPTNATVKLLYGITSRCAFPGCDEPLFKQVEALSVRALNSTVAHIHARRSNGPRWNPAMTEEQNRDQANLLLLCKFHSGVIDEFPDEYPAGLLREWKAAAEDGNGVQPPITDDEAEKIVRLSIDQDITIKAETITLGGSLGGGGAAIGFGAFGGQGGDVSAFPELSLPRRMPQGTPADSAETLTLVGEGYSAGLGGQPGGLTAIVRGDEVLMAAGGGGPGFAGTGQRSKTDLLSISTLMVAQAINHAEGLVYVLAGGWERLTTTDLPTEVNLAVELAIEAGGVPEGEYTLHVAMFGPTHEQVGRTSFPVTVTSPGQVLRILRYVPLPATLQQAGVHIISAETDDRGLAAIPLVVQLADDR